MQPERMNPRCEIEYGVFFWSYDSWPCGKRSVAQCADCGLAICEKCRTACCGDSYCASCYEYHLGHGCRRTPAPAETNAHRKTA
jgi:hypothetical protein